MKRACAIPLLALLLTLAGCSDLQGIDAVVLEDFPTLQQTTEYTCGCVSAQMVMQYYHVDDDILTMADPCDITDGRTDGYTQVSLVAFFYDWFCTMTPKPWQLQPYIVVAPE